MIQDNKVIIEKRLAAPAGQVWKAITDKDSMKEWYFKPDAFIPEPGFRFQFFGEGKEGEKYLHLCEVTEVIPGKKISYSWRYEGYEGISYVSFELFADGNHTTLVLTHSGLESFPDIANKPFAKENFEEGWTYLITTALEKYLGQLLP